MNAEIKDNWVAALESGEYEQGKNYLHSGTRFCCLGVLTDLYIKAHPEQGGWTPRDSGTEVTTFFFGPDREDYSVLPIVVRDWAGLDAASPLIEDEHLTDTNDNGASFVKIAHLIKGSDL